MPSSPDESSLVAGKAAGFGTTQWSVVLRAGQGAEEALLRLCQVYWRPLYAFVRRRGQPVHEAQDLTQSFFAHILEHHALATVAPSKGRFRSFLLVSLKHFLDNEWHKARTQKRGGGQSLVSWEELKDGDRESFEPHDEATPERVFNRRWALTLLELAIQQLHKEYMAARKAELFEKLKEYLTAGAAEKTYQELAAELNISPGAVKVAVHRLRRRFGDLVRLQISKTVANPDEIDEEIRQLFVALS